MLSGLHEAGDEEQQGGLAASIFASDELHLLRNPEQADSDDLCS